MIIKKSKKTPENPENNNETPQAGQQASNSEAIPKAAAPKPVMPTLQAPFIKERQERRRGDRRRGYRRTEDRNLISRAQEEANAIKESAAKEGFDYGINLSKEELKRLNHAITELLKTKEKALENSAPDIAFLAVKVAEKVIKKQLEVDNNIVLNIVSEVLKSLGKSETSIMIRTNPADAALVQENIPELYPYGDSNTKITIIKDEQVDWGSCIVETKSGIIDARFSTQLQILQKALEAGL
jgi:flagellar assembly protein FliH